MRIFGVVFLMLALLPAIVAAAWTWLEIARTEEQLRAIGNFEGMHLEE
jgi:hypothetical protein